MRVDISGTAENDLEEIGDYIARDNPARALSFVAELRAACQRIGAAPLATAPRPELGPGMRSGPEGRYVIFLKVERNRVLIVRVLHGARDRSSLLP